MSGGSYNYLCYKANDFTRLIEHRHNLQEMAERLSALPWARDAAVETERLVAMIQRLEIQIEARAGALEGVWKAVEWWDSCDWGEDSVRRALAEYRGEGAPEERP